MLRSSLLFYYRIRQIEEESIAELLVLRTGDRKSRSARGKLR